MGWLDRIKAEREEAVHMSKVLGIVPERFVIDLADGDRFIEIAERMEYLCLCEFPCEERHCPERGVDYVVHDSTCPYAEEWRKP